jgi:hypothetical protein
MRDEWTRKLPDGITVTYSYECSERAGCVAHARLDPGGITYTHPAAPPGLSRDEVEELFRGRF